MTGYKLPLTGLLFAILALAGLCAPQRAHAQDCVLDRCLREGAQRQRETQRPQQEAPRPQETARQPVSVAPGDFDYYVLALSWSPGFCALSGGRDRQQCDGG